MHCNLQVRTPFPCGSNLTYKSLPDVLVFESEAHGNVLVLDGAIQCTEKLAAPILPLSLDCGC